MPALQGGTDNETYELFQKHLVDEKGIDSESEALDFAVRYTLQHKYNIDV